MENHHVSWVLCNKLPEGSFHEPSANEHTSTSGTSGRPYAIEAGIAREPRFQSLSRVLLQPEESLGKKYTVCRRLKPWDGIGIYILYVYIYIYVHNPKFKFVLIICPEGPDRWEGFHRQMMSSEPKMKFMSFAMGFIRLCMRHVLNPNRIRSEGRMKQSTKISHMRGWRCAWIGGAHAYGLDGQPTWRGILFELLKMSPS